MKVITTTEVMMSNQSYNKEELQKEVDNKARASIQSDDGLDQLVRFTLDNFAYRYLETKNNKDLKSALKADQTWGVESKESDLLEALKAQNPQTKKLLIQKAKDHAKKDGATVTLALEIKIMDSLALCKASVSWNSDSKDVIIAENQTKLAFEDLLDLRNRLAKVLEDACGVF